MKKVIAGNWKMNGIRADGLARVKALAAFMQGSAQKSFDMVIFPPFTLLDQTRQNVGDCGLLYGAQDCHVQPQGAFTGDISPAMLKDLGCEYVLLGHSERRQHHAEKDEAIALKAKSAHSAGLITIICVGETESERVQSKQNDIVAAQLRASLPPTSNAENTIIAYEPVWAIGTGKQASESDIKDMHAFIHSLLPRGMRILYGGSVKAAMSQQILNIQHVNGVLVGGASLNVDEFIMIAKGAC